MLTTDALLPTAVSGARADDLILTLDPAFQGSPSPGVVHRVPTSTA